jgi:hypothetical protein
METCCNNPSLTSGASWSMSWDVSECKTRKVKKFLALKLEILYTQMSVITQCSQILVDMCCGIDSSVCIFIWQLVNNLGVDLFGVTRKG